MIQRLVSVFFVGTGLLALSHAVLAQNVTGEITDPGRTIAFPGAIVSIEGLSGSTTSDERGRFRLGNVPAGSYTLIVSYVGTEDTSISIQVPEARPLPIGKRPRGQLHAYRVLRRHRRHEHFDSGT